MMSEIFFYHVYGDLSHFTSLILPCWRDNFNSFSCILLKFVLYAANNQFNDGGGLYQCALVDVGYALDISI